MTTDPTSTSRVEAEPVDLSRRIDALLHTAINVADSSLKGILEEVHADFHDFCHAVRQTTAATAQDPAGTMAEVERLVDDALSARAAFAQDVHHVRPSKGSHARLVNACSALLDAYRAIITERDEARSNAERFRSSMYAVEEQSLRNLTRAETAEAERDDSRRRHAVTEIEACNLASEVGRLRAELAALRAEQVVPDEVVTLSDQATQGEWTTGEDADGYRCINGAGARPGMIDARVEWFGLAQVVVEMEGGPSPSGLANAALIPAAVNRLRAQIATTRGARDDG